MIAGLIIGAAAMFFVLFGLYVIRHVRVMQKIQTTHYDRMLKFEKAMAAVTSAQESLRQEGRGLRNDVRRLRRRVNTLDPAEDEESNLGDTASTPWEAFEDTGVGGAEFEDDSPTISAWGRLMGDDEP